MASTSEQAIQGFRVWFKAMGDAAGLADAQVRMAEPTGDAPRSSAAYVTVRELANVGVGDRQECNSLSGADPIVYYKQFRRMTISLQGYGTDAGEWMERAFMLLGSPASLALLTAQGVTIRAGGGRRNIAQLLDTGFEPRWSQDVEIEYIHSTQPDAETQTALATAVTTITTQVLPLDEVDPDALVNTSTYP